MAIKKTLGSRITFIFLITIMISILIYTIVVMQNTYDLSKKQMENLTKALSENIIKNTDLILGNMDRAAIILLNSEEVRKAMIDLQDPSLDYFTYREHYDELIYSSYMVTTSREFFSTAFFGKNGDLLVSSSQINNGDPNLFLNTTGLDRAKDTHHVILSPDENTFEFDHIDNPTMNIRAMIEPTLGTIAGYVAVFIDAKLLSSRTSYPVSDASTSLPSYSTMILNRFQEPIEESGPEIHLSSKDYVTSSTTSSYSGWSSKVGLPVKNYLAIAFTDKILALLLPLLIIAVSTILLLRYLIRVLDPLNDLIGNLKYIHDGDYSHTIDEFTGLSDLDSIFSDFNIMTRELDRLINTVYANELLFHKVQLQMLKLQINPHFLYNTLQTIEALGEINDVAEVSEISYLLGKILRYNLNDSDLVPLSEELDSVKDYLKIQQIRFEESLIYFIQLGDRTGDIKVPKFILQPIIENCIVHGHDEDFTNTLIITITSEFEDDCLVLRIRDNGKGISTSRLKELNCLLEKVESREENSLHIGLYNVNKRLKTRFGSQYRLVLDSEENGYTEIKYSIPVEKRGEV